MSSFIPFAIINGSGGGNRTKFPLLHSPYRSQGARAAILHCQSLGEWSSPGSPTAFQMPPTLLRSIWIVNRTDANVGPRLWLECPALRWTSPAVFALSELSV